MPPGIPKHTLEKPKNFKKAIFTLLKYCKSFIFAGIIAIIFVIVGNILHVIGPNFMGNMTNEIMKGLPNSGSSINFENVNFIAIFLICIYGISVILSFLEGFILATITQEITKKLRKDIITKITKLPLKYFDTTSHGDILSRMTNDVDTIGMTLNQSLSGLISAIIMFFGSLFMMFYNSWILTLVAVGSSLIGFFAMGFIMKFSQKYFIAQQKVLGDLNGHIEEIYSNHNIVKTYNGEENAIKKFEKYNDDLYISGWKSQFFSGLMMPVMMFVGNFSYVAVCVVGAILAVNNIITFGVIVAFMVYIRLFTQPLSQIAQSFQNLQRTTASSERVFEFLEEEEMEDEKGKPSLNSLF